MRILLDECLDTRLKKDIPGHDVRTVRDMGWMGKKNGELLRMAEAQFEVFLTADRNLTFQRPVAVFKISVLVLVAKTNRLQDHRLLMGAVFQVLQDVKPGEIREVRA